MGHGKKLPGFLYHKDYQSGKKFTEPGPYNAALEEGGWYESPQDLNEAGKPEVEKIREKLDSAIVDNKEKTKAEERSEALKKREAQYEEGLLRHEAKEAGIKNIGNKSVETLRRELAEMQEN